MISLITTSFCTDREIVESENYSEMRLRLERVHNAAYNYIGGSIGHFTDPFVFLIHSNVETFWVGL
jgi:hypothetical protein